MHNRCEIDENDQVLLHLSTGKTYLFSEEQRPQSPQKKGTCWYYALVPLRNRYGNQFEQLKRSQLDSPSVELALSERQKEKHISAFRKTLTKLNEQREIEKHILEVKFEKKNLTLIEARQKLAVIQQASDAKSSNANQDEIHLLTAFCESEQVNLHEFCSNRSAKKRIQNSIDLLENLNLDVELELKKQLKLSFPNRLTPLSLNEKVVLYFLAAKNAAIKAYRLSVAPWNPHQEVNQLKTCLRKHGLLAVFGFNGIPYYTKKDTKIQTPFTSRHTFYQLDEKYFDKSVQDRGSHAVNIVGALKINGTHFVAFRDPKQGSMPTKDNSTEIYLAEYESFCSRITSIHGLNSQEAKGDFAVCANESKLHEVRVSAMQAVTLFKISTIKHTPPPQQQKSTPAKTVKVSVVTGYRNNVSNSFISLAALESTSDAHSSLSSPTSVVHAVSPLSASSVFSSSSSVSSSTVSSASLSAMSSTPVSPTSVSSPVSPSLNQG